MALLRAAPSPSTARDTTTREQPAVSLILGVVADSTGRGVPDVQVLLVGVLNPVVTDSLGRFRLGPLKASSYVIQFRRLGFEGVTHVAQLLAADTLRLAIELQPVANQLATVNVTGESVSERLSRVGFVRRRADGAVPASRFTTRAEFDKRPPLTMTELLRRMGNFPSRCPSPTVFVDGALLGSSVPLPPPSTPRRKDQFLSDGPPPPPAIDAIPPVTVEAVEVYLGPAEFPLEYKPAGRGFSCLVLVWTRI